MKIIERKQYLDKILPFINTPFIKVLTGMRRIGKTTLMMTIKNDVLKDVPEENKLYLNFEEFKNMDIKNYEDLYYIVKPFLERQQGMKYFFFDEIQTVGGWQKLINGLRLEKDCDIYVAGSRKTLLDGELSTLLTGRYVEFEIRSFTFKEYCEYRGNFETKERMFEEYMTTGGLPALLDFNERSVKQVYLDFYSTVVYRDILGGNPTKTMDLVDRVINFIMINIGNTFSANRIKNFLKNGQRTTSVDTILNILKRCEDAYLIKKAPRYEINGKKILKTEEKYYLAEHGIREANGYSNKKDAGRVLENIVFNELIAREYMVNVGKIKGREIDFVAEKGEETKHIQVCHLLADENIQKREFGAFDRIKEHYERIVLSMDKTNFSQNGIRHHNIIDFLLN